MTRETKIGLLVGLAFIIVIGILLSDHLTTSNEPPSAPLAKAGQTVRQAVTTIGQPTAPVIITAPERVEPSAPIVTRQELHQPKPIELVAGPVQAQAQRSPADRQTDAFGPATTGTGPVITQTPSAMATDPLARVAAEHGEELQVIGAPSSNTNVPQTARQQQDVQPAVPVSTRSYVAQPGDSVSRIAARMLGANNKANREAIIRANPSLTANPNKIIVGRTYLIPTGPIPQAPAIVIPVRTADARPAPVRTSSTSNRTRSGATYWYTVKENDSLWKIASEQIGTGNAYQQIKDLNKDILKGSDNVRPSMRLRLPARPIASAAD